MLPLLCLGSKRFDQFADLRVGADSQMGRLAPLEGLTMHAGLYYPHHVTRKRLNIPHPSIRRKFASLASWDGTVRGGKIWGKRGRWFMQENYPTLDTK